MYTVRFTNNGAHVFHNDNGPEIVNFVSNQEIKALRGAREDEFDPETCVELRAVFAAESDFELVNFTIINETGYGIEFHDAIDAVACVYLDSMRG